MKLIQLITRFLKQNLEPHRPILIGLSGGPDSLCLLHLLLEVKNKIPFSLHVAHVDHGWRSESGQEAEILKNLAQKLQLPFHTLKLDPKSQHGNLEEACRLKRLTFFKQICKETGCQAVILGHHADDQAETVLKRLFEGASLPNLSGMQSIIKMDGLIIWRPLLGISKQEISEWLEKRSINAFQDSTNNDPTFLRGRLRSSLIPFLSEQFGKGISSSLSRVGFEANELRNYFDEKIEPHLGKVIRHSSGSYIDLSGIKISKVELKHLIRRIFELEGISASYQIIDTATHLIDSRASDRKICVGNRQAMIDRQRLFILKNRSHTLLKDNVLFLNKGNYQYLDWDVSVEIGVDISQTTSWFEAWEGKCEVILPIGSYNLGPPQMNTPYLKCEKISKWWNNHKIPAFLRREVPVIWSEGKVVHEFLTGKLSQKLEDQGLRISLRRRF